MTAPKFFKMGLWKVVGKELLKWLLLQAIHSRQDACCLQGSLLAILSLFIFLDNACPGIIHSTPSTFKGFKCKLNIVHLLLLNPSFKLTETLKMAAACPFTAEAVGLEQIAVICKCWN